MSLKLVPYEDPILRQKTQTVEFPLSPADQTLINSMLEAIQPENLKKDQPNWSAAGMASNQWGLNKRIFIYCPDGNENGKIEVIINPSYEPTITAGYETDWEGCFSVPLASGNIKRYNEIKVKYQNESGELITKKLSDWEARVWQHETDHLDGFLYDDPRHGKCCEKKNFATYAELDAFHEKNR